MPAISVSAACERGAAKQRKQRFERIEGFDRQLRQLEAEIRQKVSRRSRRGASWLRS